jgi:hypothetical protein
VCVRALVRSVSSACERVSETDMLQGQELYDVMSLLRELLKLGATIVQTVR